MDNGILRCGFFASSPVVATQSKPTNPKKHLAAPAITPAIPNGMNPPSPPPLFSRTVSGMLSLGIVQLDGSAESQKMSNNKYQVKENNILASVKPLIIPVTITNTTVHKFITVNILFSKLDSLTPTAKSIDTSITMINEKKSGYAARKLTLIGINSFWNLCMGLPIRASR